MELKSLKFEIVSINRLLECGQNVDKIELHLNGTLCNSSDQIVDDYSEPVYLEWYGNRHNVQGLDAFISVTQRPSRSDVPGIDCSEPWKSNDEPRDTIRIDEIENDSVYRSVSLSLYLPSEIWSQLYSTDLDRRKVYVNAQIVNSGENPLRIENPSSFFYSYLSAVTVNILSVVSRRGDDEA